MADPVDDGTVTDEVRNPMCTEQALRRQRRATASPRTAPRCTSTAASPRGSATARRTSGSRPPTRTRRGRRASASGTCPTWSALSAGVPDCTADDDGCQTFYYTNQQSARLMFYHDHAWGITRLNVYAGEAAGYLITDADRAEADRRRRRPRRPRRGHPARHPGPHLRPVRRPARRAGPDVGRLQVGRHGQPLVPPRLHARPEPRRPVGHERLRSLDVRPVVLAAGHAAATARSPTRTTTRTRRVRRPWALGSRGSRRLHDDLARPATSTTRRRGSTRSTRSASPQQIPGTPNISVGMEQFNDTPIVNGTAYPTTTARPEVVPLPHPERGQRPLLEPVLVRRRQHRHRGRPQGGRGRRGADRHQHRPDAGHGPQPRRARLDPDRHRGRLPAGPDGRSGRSRRRGSPTRPASTSATSTSTRCCWLRPSAAT